MYSLWRRYRGNKELENLTKHANGFMLDVKTCVCFCSLLLVQLGYRDKILRQKLLNY
jgi:hypothetical protein